MQTDGCGRLETHGPTNTQTLDVIQKHSRTLKGPRRSYRTLTDPEPQLRPWSVSVMTPCSAALHTITTPTLDTDKAIIRQYDTDTCTRQTLTHTRHCSSHLHRLLLSTSNSTTACQPSTTESVGTVERAAALPNGPANAVHLAGVEASRSQAPNASKPPRESLSGPGPASWETAVGRVMRNRDSQLNKVCEVRRGAMWTGLPPYLPILSLWIVDARKYPDDSLISRRTVRTLRPCAPPLLPSWLKSAGRILPLP
ncbi:hypothetical protein EDB80DRAFT_292263 [Ilyonectria destructans]|nr:hypothetical protein EDB80DRAFT_292263 [Ilyonectria destructans]